MATLKEKKKGDIVILVTNGKYWEDEIASVGRKYITLLRGYGKYDIETGNMKNWCGNKIYPDMETFNAEQLRIKTRRDVDNYFRGYGSTPLSDEKYKQIYEIVFGDGNNNDVQP